MVPCMILVLLTTATRVLCKEQILIEESPKVPEDFMHACDSPRGECFRPEYKSIVTKYYTGLFFTREVAERPKNHDHDYCCPTRHSHRNRRYLRNTRGKIRRLVHMDFLSPPRYQWYPHAVCVGDGACRGSCQIEESVVYLLVFKMRSNPPFEFDAFLLPSYCSCKV